MLFSDDGSDTPEIDFYSTDDESRAAALVSYVLLTLTGLEPEIVSDMEVLYHGRQMSMKAFLAGLQCGLVTRELREAGLQHAKVFRQVAAAFEKLASVIEEEQGLEPDLQEAREKFRAEAAPSFVVEIKSRHPELFTEEAVTKLAEQDRKALWPA